ncbi:MAG: NUDIX hydrolase [Pseudomonadota bacterium]
MDAEADFHGAKVALFLDDQLLVYRRDDKADIPFPNMIDLPGGGRENGESGRQCVVRETQEEFGIAIDAETLQLTETYENWRGSGPGAMFFAGQLTSEQVAAIRFGDEGQDWHLMKVSDFLKNTDVVPHLQHRLRAWLDRKSA